MLTEAHVLDVAPTEAMLAVSEIAKRDGISRQAVSKRVKDLVSTHGLTVRRGLSGVVLAVNVVQYDLLRERYGDQSQVRVRKDPTSVPPGPPVVDSRSYDEATRRRAWLEMEKRRLEVAELRGQLLRKDRYEEAVGACGDELIRVIEQLPQKADALAVELGCDDVHSVRRALKQLARELRGDLAKKFEALAAAAPEMDESLPDFDEDEG